MEVSLNEIARAPVCMGSEPQFPCQWLLGLLVPATYNGEEGREESKLRC